MKQKDRQNKPSATSQAIQIYSYDVLNALSAHIAVLDQCGVIHSVNQAWKQFAEGNGGDNKAFYVGTNYLSICKRALEREHDETVEAAFSGLNAVMCSEQEEFSLEYPCHSPTQQRWFNFQVKRFSSNAYDYLVVSHADITARKQAELELLATKDALEVMNQQLQNAIEREQQLARTDSLTGLNNSRQFFNLATHEFAMAKRHRHSLSVLLFDIDWFKRINDTFGHQAGNEVLKQVAQIIKEHMRDVDVLARYGGDESPCCPMPTPRRQPWWASAFAST